LPPTQTTCTGWTSWRSGTTAGMRS
jgi:hypothetical protein